MCALDRALLDRATIVLLIIGCVPSIEVVAHKVADVAAVVGQPPDGEPEHGVEEGLELVWNENRLAGVVESVNGAELPGPLRWCKMMISEHRCKGAYSSVRVARGFTALVHAPRQFPVNEEPPIDDPATRKLFGCHEKVAGADVLVNYSCLQVGILVSWIAC